MTEHEPLTYRTRPDKCPKYGHPGVTYNQHEGKTWCLCGQVVRDGEQLTYSDQWPHLAACCDGPLTEVIPR